MERYHWNTMKTLGNITVNMIPGDMVRFNLLRDSTRYCVGLIVEIEEFEGVPWYKILVGNVFEHVPIGYGGPPFEIKVLK